jgi:hypothetical protein
LLEMYRAVHADLLHLLIPLSSQFTQQVSLLVELFLRNEYAEDRAKIAELCQTDSASNDKLLSGYIREGMRVSAVVIGLRESSVILS